MLRKTIHDTGGSFHAAHGHDVKEDDHETHRDGTRLTEASLRANNRIGSDDDGRSQSPELNWESTTNFSKVQELLFGVQLSELSQRISHLEKSVRLAAGEFKPESSRAKPDLQEPPTSTAPRLSGNLENLQELLLAVERRRLDVLEERLRNSVVDAPAVADVLPEAIYQRTKQDQHLEKSLMPIFGKVFVRAVKGQPQLIADAISPVMMPAIRKAVGTAVQDMVQFTNRTLEAWLSWRGMPWRWEALRTGKSFGEVVLSHTLRYQVERVFLFFREDGIHLADVHRPDVPSFEPGHEDLVTSMFSAIKAAVQKFAQDEFQAAEHASPQTFEMDDNRKVLIEQGPKAVLVAVVHGLPSTSLRTKLQDTLDSIHVELNEALQNFRGDKKPFEAAIPHLESCLLHEQRDSSNEEGSARGRLSPVLVVVLLLPVIWLIWSSVTSYVEWQRWENFQDKVRETPGIQLTFTKAANGKHGKTTVYGLRDPLSVDPEEIAREVGLPHEAIDFQFEPYLSLAPELIERRARDSRQRLDQLIQEIEAPWFEFEAGSASLAEESEPSLQALLMTLHKSDKLAQELGSRIQVEIRGNTSEEGSEGTHRRLALARAQRILSALNAEKFSATDLLPVADSVGPLATTETRGSKPLRARRVSFHVTVNDSGSMGPRL